MKFGALADICLTNNPLCRKKQLFNAAFAFHNSLVKAGRLRIFSLATATHMPVSHAELQAEPTLHPQNALMFLATEDARWSRPQSRNLADCATLN